jgi:hypothetical protein
MKYKHNMFWAADGLWVAMAVLLLVRPSASGEVCSVENQRLVVKSMAECKPRHNIIDLRGVLAASNKSQELNLEPGEVVQVVPESVAVARCGGGCHLPAHSCIPARVEVRTVEVLLVLAQWPLGEHRVVCTELQVEEHADCECGCRVKPQDCGHNQIYQPNSCRWGSIPSI